MTMKTKFFSKGAALLLALVLTPLSTLAANFEEGKHFTVVNQGAATKTPEIVEFFSYLCPHCYKFEPLIEGLVEKKPDNVKFKKNHVDFLGRDLGPELSRAYAVAYQLKLDDKITPKIFSAIHDKRQRFANFDDLKALFVSNGVDAKKFDAAANSFMVNAMVSQMQKNTKKFKINSVPTLIVNGKYRVETKHITSNEEFQELVFFLTEKRD